MNKKRATGAVAVVLCGGLLFFWVKHHRGQYDIPERFANLIITEKEMQGWDKYQDAGLGLEIKYPNNYYPCPHSKDHIRYPFIPRVTFRQDANSEKECRTAGLRIGLDLFRLGKISRISLGSRPIDLTENSTVEDIAEQFFQGENRPAVLLTRHFRTINGIATTICTIRAPGESPLLHGHIFEVYILGVHAAAKGERFLAILSNSAGGTPRIGDRALRRDLLLMFHTLRWIE